MFCISADPIDSEVLRRDLEDHAAGAFVCFEGRVRQQNEGRAVAKLEYEIFPELCLSEGEKILQEARRLFPLVDVKAVHRFGLLELGDVAVWIGVISAHRGAGFQACRYIIDAIKARCPIWKKEHYRDGPSDWIGCPSCEHHAHSGQALFARQQPLVGTNGQKTLADSRILIIGMGGLGCPAALHLAAAGLGFLRVCDGDRLDASNLHRQTLYSYHDVGSQKVWLAKRRLEELHPYCKVEAIAETFTSHNAQALLADIDLILDCSDNFASKYLSNDLCVRAGLPYVHASIYQNQGQLQVYRPGQSPCLRCTRPLQPPADCMDSCEETGVLGAATSILGSWMALEAIKILLGQESTATTHSLHLDLDRSETLHIARSHDPKCPLCADHRSDFVYEQEAAHWELPYEELQARSDAIWIDIREWNEARTSLPSAHRMPLSGMDETFFEEYRGRSIILLCEKGMRSRKLARKLREQSFEQVYSLLGGLAALSQPPMLARCGVAPT